MSKRLVLMALLLPLSGYGITKEERKQEIDTEAANHIWNGMHDLMYIVCMYSKCIDLSSLSKEDREWFLKKMEELKNTMDKLQKEYKELEQA